MTCSGTALAQMSCGSDDDYDRNRKMPLYAKSGVPEVWIENLQSDVILVYRDPGPQTYATALAVHQGESISIAAFPDIPFTVDELLG